ncbi:beta-lactamase family protein [Nonomuraea sp. NN258]|uniref:serine hydrolase domain-containing protein n=1 Tax=Nonomuraea antri TaxID=2730852 RepID=UPI0015690A2C|nr:serine hydrolase domain-containing protein [Nonomuraea antri]NRQ37286.1 beta-lactamase family protein [Nonomuraea antri]
MTLLRFRTLATRLTAAATAGLLLLAGAPAGPAAATQDAGLDRHALRKALNAVHEAGMYGIYSHVADGRQSWKGAAGVADVETRRPVRPDLRHRVGSITKTFTATAVLQQVARGTIELDAPIGRYLPDLVPGEVGQQVTVRMLLNHTSHIADYDTLIFTTVESLEANRFRTYTPQELVRMALAAPPTGSPGATPGSYSNTNYTLAGLLLERVTGVSAERYITDHVIRRAGLRHTSFPHTPVIFGPHSKGYESLFGQIDPPRDFSVYNPSIYGLAGALVSTMEDLDRFYRVLLRGGLLDAGMLAEMQKIVPVSSGAGSPVTFDYGLGLFPVDLPCGRFWGHDGTVLGMSTVSLTKADGSRQVSFGINLTHYPSEAIDTAIQRYLMLSTCGTDAGATTAATPPFTPFQRDALPIKR